MLTNLINTKRKKYYLLAFLLISAVTLAKTWGPIFISLLGREYREITPAQDQAQGFPGARTAIATVFTADPTKILRQNDRIKLTYANGETKEVVYKGGAIQKADLIDLQRYLYGIKDLKEWQKCHKGQRIPLQFSRYIDTAGHWEGEQAKGSNIRFNLISDAMADDGLPTVVVTGHYTPDSGVFYDFSPEPSGPPVHPICP